MDKIISYVSLIVGGVLLLSLVGFVLYTLIYKMLYWRNRWRDQKLSKTEPAPLEQTLSALTPRRLAPLFQPQDQHSQARWREALQRARQSPNKAARELASWLTNPDADIAQVPLRDVYYVRGTEDFWRLLAALPHGPQTEEATYQLAALWVESLPSRFRGLPEPYVQQAPTAYAAMIFLLYVAKECDPGPELTATLEEFFVSMLSYEELAPLVDGYPHSYEILAALHYVVLDEDLPDPEKTVRTLAICGLGLLGSEEVVQKLQNYIWAPSWWKTQQQRNQARQSISMIQQRAEETSEQATKAHKKKSEEYESALFQ